MDSTPEVTWGTWIILLVMLAIYFIPTIVAIYRHHPNSGPIVIVNMFLGWTLLGWVGALAWAATAIKKETTAP